MVRLLNWLIVFFVDMIFLDFSKAFGVVNQFIMLTKLRMLGIGGKLLSWIREFLSGWTMSVKGCRQNEQTEKGY